MRAVGACRKASSSLGTLGSQPGHAAVILKCVEADGTRIVRVAAGQQWGLAAAREPCALLKPPGIHDPPVLITNCVRTVEISLSIGSGTPQRASRVRTVSTAVSRSRRLRLVAAAG